MVVLVVVVVVREVGRLVTSFVVAFEVNIGKVHDFSSDFSVVNPVSVKSVVVGPVEVDVDVVVVDVVVVVFIVVVVSF